MQAKQHHGNYELFFFGSFFFQSDKIYRHSDWMKTHRLLSNQWNHRCLSERWKRRKINSVRTTTDDYERRLSLECIYLISRYIAIERRKKMKALEKREESRQIDTRNTNCLLVRVRREKDQKRIERWVIEKMSRSMDAYLVDRILPFPYTCPTSIYSSLCSSIEKKCCCYLYDRSTRVTCSFNNRSYRRQDTYERSRIYRKIFERIYKKI